MSVYAKQNVVLYTGDAADRALIQQHELRFASDPKASKRAKFNVLLVRYRLHAVFICGLCKSLSMSHLSALSSLYANTHGMPYLYVHSMA